MQCLSAFETVQFDLLVLASFTDTQSVRWREKKKIANVKPTSLIYNGQGIIGVLSPPPPVCVSDCLCVYASALQSNGENRMKNTNVCLLKERAMPLYLRAELAVPST